MPEVTLQPCPHNNCNSSNAFCWNTDENVGHCKSCDQGYPLKGMSLKSWARDRYKLVDKRGKGGYSKKKKSEVDDYWDSIELLEEETTMTKDIKVKQEGDLKVVAQARRNITPKTMKFYGVDVLDDDAGPFKETYPYPAGVKTRYITEKGFSVTGSINALFGQNLFGPASSKMLTITEGELDAMSAFQMLNAGSAYVNPVVSLSSASPSRKMWEDCQEWINSFDKIVLSVDKDKAGDRVAEQISKMFLGKVYRVNHGEFKDANEFLVAGKGKEFVSGWWNAKKVKPDSILSDGQDLVDLYDNTPDYEYCPTGIPELDQKMLGLHKAAFTLILAPTGIGKTEFMRYLENQILTQSDYSLAFCHLEETDLRSTLGLVSYKLGTNVTRKDLVAQKGLEAEVKAAMVELTEGGRYNQFKMNADDGPDELVEKIRFLVTAMGVDYIFFEPIQDIVAGNTSDKESKLTDLANTLKRLAPELNVGLVFIAHANEDGDAKYCKSLVQSAAYEIVLSRDSDAEDYDEANTTNIFVGRKNRVGGGSGPAGALTFSEDTYTLTPVTKFQPQVPISKGEF